jgi:hypothetical protein
MDHALRVAHVSPQPSSRALMIVQATQANKLKQKYSISTAGFVLVLFLPTPILRLAHCHRAVIW